MKIQMDICIIYICRKLPGAFVTRLFSIMEHWAWCYDEWPCKITCILKKNFQYKFLELIASLLTSLCVRVCPRMCACVRVWMYGCVCTHSCTSVCVFSPSRNDTVLLSLKVVLIICLHREQALPGLCPTCLESCWAKFQEGMITVTSPLSVCRRLVLELLGNTIALGCTGWK